MALKDSCRRVAGRVRAWPRRVLITIAVVVVLLVGVRIALPFIVENQVNKRLAAIPGYSGHVDGIGISLLRGAYTIREIDIAKVEGEVRQPFFTARKIDFSLAWRELFRGKIVSDIEVDQPDINFVKDPNAHASTTDVDRRWQDVLEDLFPIDITHFQIRNGAIRYRDMTRVPNIDVFLKNMHATATGLRNRAGEDGQEFPARISIDGETLGEGKIQLRLAAEPLADQPHFHLSVKVDGVNLVALNESLKSVANVDVGRGTFRMAAEMAGRDGGFQGYVKPFFEDLNFNNLEDKKKNMFSRIWENIVGGLAWLVKNKSRDQVGTRIPFQGRFGDPQVGLGTTIANLFRHGFIRAFNPTVEGSVDPDNVLPTGDSTNGQKVADKKEDPSVSAGAPTGREPPRNSGRK